MTAPFAAGCLLCAWERPAADAVAAEQLAGAHDDQNHGGMPTAWVERLADLSEEDRERSYG